MLEAGDDLRLAFEPADEVRVVRELRMHRLDRDLAADLRLDRPVDDAERTLADLVEQPIPAERLALQIQVGVFAEDPFVQPPEVRGGIDAELAGQLLTRPFERRERIGRTPRAVQGQHEELPQPLAERQLARERLELADDLPVPALGEVGGDPLLERLQTQLVEPRDLGRRATVRTRGRRRRDRSTARALRGAGSPLGRGSRSRTGPRAGAARSAPRRARRLRRAARSRAGVPRSGRRRAPCAGARCSCGWCPGRPREARRSTPGR